MINHDGIQNIDSDIQKDDLKIAFNSSIIGMWVLDENYVIKHSNIAFLKMLDKGIDEVTDRRIGNGI